MPWVWSCHRCHARYLLSATRRCLHDGHYFCGGITVDKISRKVKKHRACISEFDYRGWEDFGRWKRATAGHVVSSKHCEDECIFPSSCHWTEHHAVQETKSKNIDPSCLDMESDTSSVKGTSTDQTSTGNHIGKLGKAAEKRTTQAAKALLPPIEEEEQKAASPLGTTPSLNGLSLHFPVMDFSSPKNDANEGGELVDKTQMKLLIPKSPQTSGRVDKVWEEDVDMTDWITQDACDSSPVSPCAPPDAAQVSFDFRLEAEPGAPASPADDDSPISPMRSAWSWTAGGIGIALSPPALPVEEEIWEEEMDDEMDDGNMLWDRWESRKPDIIDKRRLR